MPGSPKQPKTNLYSTRSDLGERIQRLAERAGGKRQLARAAGIRESQLYRYIRGDNVPSLEVAVALAGAANARLEWLAYGSGPVGSDDAQLEEPRADYSSRSGRIAPPTPDGWPSPVSFSADWLTGQGLSPECLFVVRVPDDSMEPTFRRDDLALADTRHARSAAPGLLLVRLGGIHTLRRAVPLADGSLRLDCDNPAYPGLPLQPEDASGPTLLGRIVWTARRT